MIWVLSKRNFRLVREGAPSNYRIWTDKGIEELIKFYTCKAEIMREFAAARWATGERYGAHHFKLERRRYEQALIKLKRERDRRKCVYNLS